MRTRLSQFLLASVSAVLAAQPPSCQTVGAQSLAQPPGAMASASELKAISALENSCFQHEFVDDLPEKRLKRLELFVSGMGGWGSVSHRIAALKTAIAAKNHPATTELTPSHRDAGLSVTTLEKSVLKHTYPQLDLKTRLATLEKKVFGAGFPNLPVEQRIKRLQKTIGIVGDDIAVAPLDSRTGEQLTLPPGSMFSSPFMAPFGSPGELTTDPELNRHMSQMFDHLQRQLQQLHQLPGDSFMNQQPGQTPRQFLTPNVVPEYSDGLPSAPSQLQKPTLPPYMDPNSI